MNIVDAVKSEFPYRRKSWPKDKVVLPHWQSASPSGFYLKKADIVADDWEVMPPEPEPMTEICQPRSISVCCLKNIAARTSACRCCRANFCTVCGRRLV